MKVLAVGRPREGTAAPQIAAHARDEMAALWRLYRAGVVREAYSPGGPCAVLVLEVPDRASGLAAVAGLPLAGAGLIEFELTELHPFGAFEVLFGEPAREKERSS